MASKKSARKSNRLEAVANETFKRFSQADWNLTLAEGDEISEPEPKSVQDAMRSKFYAMAEMVNAATERVNLRNVSARYARGRISRELIPSTCARVRASIRNR